MACTNGNATCIPIGPTGATGATGPEGPIGPIGPGASFLNSYIDSTASVELGSGFDLNWVGDDTWYKPTGFTTLLYTNVSGVSKDFIVNVNYSSGSNTGINAAEYGKSNVSCGIFKGGDLINSLWYVDAAIQLAFGAAAVSIYSTKQNNNLFKKITLDIGESVHIQFKTKSIGDGYLQKAQMFIQEL